LKMRTSQNQQTIVLCARHALRNRLVYPLILRPSVRLI
jgi:hypothetical protein